MITLNKERTCCAINGQELKLEQTIDYNSAAPNAKPSMGKIKAFKHPGYMQSDKTSVWMEVADLQETGTTEWISVINWAVKYTKPTEDDTSKQPPAEDLPF